MKLGKGPTSVLDRHSTLNDITALRLCTRFLFLTLYHELSKVDHNDNDEFFFSLSRAKSSMTFCQAMLLEKKKKIQIKIKFDLRVTIYRDYAID